MGEDSTGAMNTRRQGSLRIILEAAYHKAYLCRFFLVLFLKFFSSFLGQHILLAFLLPELFSILPIQYINIRLISQNIFSIKSPITYQ